MSVKFIPDDIHNFNDEFFHVRDLLDLIKNENPDLVIFHSFDNYSESHNYLFKELTNNDLVILSTNGLFVLRVLRDLKTDSKTGADYYHKTIDNTDYIRIDNPFDFTNSQRYKIYKKFKEYNPDKKDKIICCSGIALTMSKLEKSSIDIDEVMVFNAKSNIKFIDYLSKLRDYSLERKNLSNESKNDDNANCIICLSKEEIQKEIIRMLDIKTSHVNDNETYCLTKEQKNHLTILNDSSYAIIRGGAGTGKTELAIELVNKLKKHGFDKVVFFTFNRLLSNEVKKIAIKKFPNLEFEIYPIKDYFVDFVRSNNNILSFEEQIRDDFDLDSLPNKEKGIFYDVTLPKLMFKVLNKVSPNFEAIIVDQAQDIINTSENLMIISLMLEKRMSGGRFYFFGDFKNQLLFDDIDNKNKFKQMILGITSKSNDEIVDIQLTHNFRSSKNIINALDSIEENISIVKYSGKNDGVIKFISIESNEDLIEKINNKLDELLKRYPKKQITILSNSLCPENDLKTNDIFKNLKHFDDISLLTEDNNEDSIKLAKIRRYKGMENEVILLVDLNEYIPTDKNEPSKDILYTGISRARKEVYIFENDKDKAASEKIAKKLIKEYD